MNISNSLKIIILIIVILAIILLCILINRTKEFFENYSNVLDNRDTYINNTDTLDQKIILICQFFIPKNEERYKEVKDTLKRNVENKNINTILLLNEKIYSKEELGIDNKKIKQLNIGKRMSYYDAFKQIQREIEGKGYYIIANNDIFFDDTILNVHYGTLSKTPSVQALLRYEYRGESDLRTCDVFRGTNAPRTNPPAKNSQDVWIFHSNTIKSLNHLEKYDFMLGMPGCDNSIAYKLNNDNITIYNEPYKLRTYHNHRSNSRTQTKKDTIKGPYVFIKPII